MTVFGMKKIRDGVKNGLITFSNIGQLHCWKMKRSFKSKYRPGYANKRLEKHRSCFNERKIKTDKFNRFFIVPRINKEERLENQQNLFEGGLMA